MDTRYYTAIESIGMTVTNYEIGSDDVEIIEAETDTAFGKLSIICGSNGTAVISKPNGTVKWLYNKSSAQIRAIIKKTLTFYK